MKRFSTSPYSGQARDGRLGFGSSIFTQKGRTNSTDGDSPQGRSARRGSSESQLSIESPASSQGRRSWPTLEKSPSTEGHRDRIQVAIRARPLNSREHGSKIIWRFTEFGIEELQDDGATPTMSNKFTYDNVFGPKAGSEEVYEKQCRQIVQGSMEGYNGTIFAYGQTSSGKTYTLMGDPNSNPGVSPRAFEEVFTTIQNDCHNEYCVVVSYVEIYNESLRDLLQTDREAGHNLKIFEDMIYGPRIRGAVEHEVTNQQECLNFLMQGEKIRSYSATNMNDTSSRSHTVLQMRIKSKPVYGEEQEASAKHMRQIATRKQTIQSQLHAERATFYIVDHAAQELHSQAGEFIVSLDMSRGLAGACSTTGQTILIDDVYSDARFDSFHDKKTGFRSRSMCIVPIISNNKVLAVAQFLNKAQNAVFTPGDQRIAEEFAREVSPIMATAGACARVSSTGMLNLVDLAGSERISKTGSTGSTLKEAGYINKSLMNLGACIFALSEGKSGRIPFRDSKLTMLLSHSLGGNARTAVVCAISPATRNRGETISTLQFANRAKKIINRVQQNVHPDNHELLGHYYKEVETLRNKFRQMHVVNRWQIAWLKAALLAKRRATEHPFQMSADFKEKLEHLQSTAAQAESLCNASLSPTMPRVSISATVVASADDMSDLKSAVQVLRIPSCRDQGRLDGDSDTDPGPPEWIVEEEFERRLSQFKELQFSQPDTTCDKDVFRGQTIAQQSVEMQALRKQLGEKDEEIVELRKQMAVMELRMQMAEKEAECEKLKCEVANNYYTPACDVADHTKQMHSLQEHLDAALGRLKDMYGALPKQEVNDLELSSLGFDPAASVVSESTECNSSAPVIVRRILSGVISPGPELCKPPPTLWAAYRASSPSRASEPVIATLERPVSAVIVATIETPLPVKRTRNPPMMRSVRQPMPSNISPMRRGSTISPGRSTISPARSITSPDSVGSFTASATGVLSPGSSRQSPGTRRTSPPRVPPQAGSQRGSSLERLRQDLVLRQASASTPKTSGPYCWKLKWTLEPKDS